MQLIHASPEWAPDLSSPSQLAQAEQNWPGLGGSDSELAAWARLYGTACLDLSHDAATRNTDENYEEGVRSRDDEVADMQAAYDKLQERFDDVAAIAAEEGIREGCMSAVARALEDLAADDPLSDLLVLAQRLRDGV